MDGTLPVVTVGGGGGGGGSYISSVVADRATTLAGNGSAVAGLVVWGGLALVATTVSIALRRTTSAKAVLAT